MDLGVGIVEPKKVKLNLPEGGFRLASGDVFHEIEVAYEECGAPLTEDNAIFVCHALTGDAHVAGVRPGEAKASGWWEGMIGPGRAIDTNKWHVICANVIGGCSGTTGPMSINPETGKPYGSKFPRYNLSESVEVYRMFLRTIGVQHLAALIGGSYGGMQVMDWVTRCPEDMDKACLIATASSLNTEALAFDIVARASITEDPLWEGGDYYLKGDGMGPVIGLASARQLAHITYLSRDLLQSKFGRRYQQNFVDAPAEERAERDRLFRTYFQIESYLDHQADKFIRRFDANSYLHITYSMANFDAAAPYGSLEKACARVKAKCLVVSYQGDILFSADQSKEIVAALKANDKSVTYCHLESGTGHDSFLTEIEELSRLVGGFLCPHEPKTLDWQRKAYRSVLSLVPPNVRVVDIGCGDGTLLNVLRSDRQVKGEGIDIDIDRFIEAVSDGNPCLWEDADDGLSLIPDHHYQLTICSDTLQEVKNPRGLLHEALRIADEAIVSFPNFAAYRIRLTLGFLGHLPVSKALPFQWYDTPNIHCITYQDFKALCDTEGIEIVEVKPESRHVLGKLLIGCGLVNLGASRIIARIRYKKEGK